MELTHIASPGDSISKSIQNAAAMQKKARDPKMKQ
jgi:hypothetical protein